MSKIQSEDLTEFSPQFLYSFPHHYLAQFVTHAFNNEIKASDDVLKYKLDEYVITQWTPLHLLSLCVVLKKRDEIAKLFIKYFPDLIFEKDFNGDTPLFLSFERSGGCDGASFQEVLFYATFGNGRDIDSLQNNKGNNLVTHALLSKGWKENFLNLKELVQKHSSGNQATESLDKSLHEQPNKILFDYLKSKDCITIAGCSLQEGNKEKFDYIVKEMQIDPKDPSLTIYALIGAFESKDQSLIDNAVSKLTYSGLNQKHALLALTAILNYNNTKALSNLVSREPKFVNRVALNDDTAINNLINKAVEVCNLDMLKELHSKYKSLEHADPTIRFLNIAILNKCIPAVKYFVSNNPNSVNELTPGEQKLEKSPLDFATIANDSQIINFLKENGAKEYSSWWDYFSLSMGTALKKHIINLAGYTIKATETIKDSNQVKLLIKAKDAIVEAVDSAFVHFKFAAPSKIFNLDSISAEIVKEAWINIDHTEAKKQYIIDLNKVDDADSLIEYLDKHPGTYPAKYNSKDVAECKYGDKVIGEIPLKQYAEKVCLESIGLAKDVLSTGTDIGQYASLAAAPYSWYTGLSWLKITGFGLLIPSILNVMKEKGIPLAIHMVTDEDHQLRIDEITNKAEANEFSDQNPEKGYFVSQGHCPSHHKENHGIVIEHKFVGQVDENNFYLCQELDKVLKTTHTTSDYNEFIQQQGSIDYILRNHDEKCYKFNEDYVGKLFLNGHKRGKAASFNVCKTGEYKQHEVNEDNLGKYNVAGYYIAKACLKADTDIINISEEGQSQHICRHKPSTLDLEIWRPKQSPVLDFTSAKQYVGKHTDVSIVESSFCKDNQTPVGWFVDYSNSGESSELTSYWMCQEQKALAETPSAHVDL